MFNEILQKINIREIIFLSFFVRIASLILYPSKVLPDTYTYLKIGEEIFSGKINKTLVSNVLYKSNANYKGRKAKTKQKRMRFSNFQKSIIFPLKNPSKEFPTIDDDEPASPVP